MSGKFALIIGNTEYADPALAGLTAPGKDAEAFGYVLKEQNICAFDDVKVLLNQPEHIVRRAIEVYFDQRKPDDLVVFYFSGHGVLDEMGALYLAVKNTVRSRLRSTAIKSDYIREIMEQSRSKRQVLILDCCNSGAFARGTKSATNISVGTATAFEAGYGRVILTASDSTQFAWEGDQVIGETDKSLFTHFLVDGLKGAADLDGDGRITVDELYDYAYEKVKFATPKQTPSKFSSKQQGEIILRDSISIQDVHPVPLPSHLLDSIENPFADIRLGAVQQLTKVLNGKNRGLALSAKEALERIANEDDSRQVSRAAAQALESYLKQGYEESADQNMVTSTQEDAKDVLDESWRQETLNQPIRLEPETKPSKEAVKVARPYIKDQLLPTRQLPVISSALSQREKQPLQKKPTTSLKLFAIIGGLIVLVCAIAGVITLKGLSPSSQVPDAIMLQSLVPNPTNTTDTGTVVINVTSIPTPTSVLPSAPMMIIVPTDTPSSSIQTSEKPLGKIVYTCQVRGVNKDQICLINADGSNKRQLTNNNYENYYASLSPDGNRVVFVSNQTDKLEIYEMDFAGNQVQLTYGLGEEASAPEISPDGNLIVFAERINSAFKIWVMNRDGSNPHQIYSSPNGDALDPTWSPDGTRVLFASGIGDNTKQLYTIASTGTDLQIVSNEFTTRGRSDWSPLGHKIASYTGGPWQREIYMMNTDGSELQQVISDGSPLAPSFSPDGGWIAFTGYLDHFREANGCEIYILRLSDNTLQRLTDNDYCDYQPRWGN